jgi:hypothetical protein
MVQNFKFIVIVLVLSNAQYLFAFDCPAKVHVEASKFSAVAATDTQKINSFYELGEKQTAKVYIEKVLEVANNLADVNEVLTKKQSPAGSTTCEYTGSTVKLFLFPVQNEWARKGYTADLRLGKIDYDAPANANGGPSSHHGLALHLDTHLTILTKDKMKVAKRRVSHLNFDLVVQEAIDDSGTESWEEIAAVGRADVVKYTVVE